MPLLLETTIYTSLSDYGSDCSACTIVWFTPVTRIVAGRTNVTSHRLSMKYWQLINEHAVCPSHDMQSKCIFPKVALSNMQSMTQDGVLHDMKKRKKIERRPIIGRLIDKIVQKTFHFIYIKINILCMCSHACASLSSWHCSCDIT